MTKGDLKHLSSILHDLIRGNEFIMSEKIILTRRKSMATTTEDLTSPNGLVCTPICKDIGSDLQILHTGIQRLADFIRSKEGERK